MNNDIFAVTPAQMKLLEGESDNAGVSYETLMENAGTILARHIVEYAEKTRKLSGTIFLCGNGNNAGDCFVAARKLRKYGVDSTIFLLCGMPKTELARLNFERLEGRSRVVKDEQEMIKILQDDAGNAIIADGVFGTGFHGELPENVKLIFGNCRRADIAVDVPSGGNCLTGTSAEGTLEADITIAFGYVKFGMTQFPLRKLCGKIIAEDIGIPERVFYMTDYPIRILDGSSVGKLIPKRRPDSHKGDFGRLITVCGSVNMPGALVMSACAALRCGVGLLTVCTPKYYVPHFAARFPEAVFLPLDTSESGTYTEESADKIISAARKATAVLIGCGLGASEDSRRLTEKLLTSINCPIILDADGINCIAGRIDIIRQTKLEIILTPHPAEMARLCGVSAAEIQSDRLGYARKFAKKYGCTVILKGAGTIIARPDCAFVSLTGNPGMSKGGSGDVLSGIVSSLVAQGIPSEAGVYIHGKAGDKAAKRHSEQSMLPTDIIDELGGIFKEYGEY